MAISIPAVAASGMTNPYHLSSVCRKENGWLTSLYRALANIARALPSYLLHYALLYPTAFGKVNTEPTVAQNRGMLVRVAILT